MEKFSKISKKDRVSWPFHCLTVKIFTGKLLSFPKAISLIWSFYFGEGAFVGFGVLRRAVVSGFVPISIFTGSKLFPDGYD